MAARGLFHVPCDEPRSAIARRTLRGHLQPQLRGPTGPGRTHAPDVARDGGGGGGHRASDGRTRPHVANSGESDETPDHVHCRRCADGAGRYPCPRQSLRGIAGRDDAGRDIPPHRRCRSALGSVFDAGRCAPDAARVPRADDADPRRHADRRSRRGDAVADTHFRASLPSERGSTAWNRVPHGQEPLFLAACPFGRAVGADRYPRSWQHRFCRNLAPRYSPWHSASRRGGRTHRARRWFRARADIISGADALRRIALWTSSPP